MKKVLYPFTNGIYFLVIWIFVTVIAIYNCLPRNKKLLGIEKRPVYNLMVSSLGSSIEHIPQKSSSRFLVTLWMILFFILRTSYSSFLYHFIRSDIKIIQPKDIASVLENYKVLSTEVMYNLMDGQPEIQSQLIHEDVQKARIFEKAFWTGHGNNAFLMNIEMYGFANLKTKKISTSKLAYGFQTKKTDWISNHLYVVPQKVLAQNYVIYMKKNSLLKKVFDNEILRYTCFGFMEKWQRDYMDMSQINKFQNDVPLKQMNFEDVAGTFYIWSGFLIVCLIVFVVEVVSFRCGVHLQVLQ
ncbi:hypothetical protein ACFFRR_001668 [Megaselia abdita]